MCGMMVITKNLSIIIVTWSEENVLLCNLIFISHVECQINSKHYDVFMSNFYLH